MINSAEVLLSAGTAISREILKTDFGNEQAHMYEDHRKYKEFQLEKVHLIRARETERLKLFGLHKAMNEGDDQPCKSASELVAKFAATEELREVEEEKE